MTWLKFGIATLAFSFAVSAAGAFEVVDSNNGFAGPAFSQSDPDEDIGPSLNTDNFGEAHIVMRGDHEKEFDGYSYSGFTFEDQIDQHSVSVDRSSNLGEPAQAKAAPQH
jgi:hypothetical protein